MSADLTSLIDSLIPPLGWTIVHSLWQGCLFALLLAALLRAMRAARPGPRYIACCATLALMVASAIATFLVLNVRPGGDIERSSVMPSAPAAAIAINIQPPSGLLDLPAPQPAPHQPLRYIVIAWLIGVAALSCWHVGGWVCLQAMRRGPRIETWQANIDRLSARLRIPRAVRLIESVRIDVPAVVGFLRPVILVPVGILNDLSPRQVEAILAHELAHVRRHDYLVNLLQAAVETLLFYHPATWWISNRIREERENCCDDIATQICGDATIYASALAALEERRLPPVKLAPAATGRGGGTLLDRVRRILRLPPLRRTSRIRSLAAAALAIACVAVPLMINARQSDAADAPATQPASVDPAAAPGTPPVAPEPPVSAIRPDDLKVNAQDYRIAPGDLLQVSITDLVAPGVETVKSVRVSETGMISLPLVGASKPAGLTVSEAELAIQKAYQKAGILANAQISVAVTEARGQVVNVLGPLDRPGQYQIVRPDFRVLDALAVAGGRPAEMGTLRIARRQGDEQRIIEIPLERLIAGDADVNIVVRPGDTLIATPAKQPMKVVKIVVGRESLLHDGKPIDLPALKAMLKKISEAERRVTVLEVAAAAPDVTVERFFNATGQLSDLVKQFNLAHLSQTGIQPTTEPAAGAPADKPQGADAGPENGYAKLVELVRMRDQLDVGKSAYLSLGEQHPDRIKYQMMMDTMDQKIEKHLDAHPQLVGTPLATMATIPSTPAAAEDEVLSPQLLANATRLAETDPIMQGYLRARAQLLMQSDQYDGLGERHPDRLRFLAMLASANRSIRRYHQQVSTTAAATQP